MKITKSLLKQIIKEEIQSLINENVGQNIKTTRTTSLRSGPMTASDVLARVPAGSTVKLIDDSKSNWLKVDFAGKQGWIAVGATGKAQKKQHQAIDPKDTPGPDASPAGLAAAAKG